MRLIATSRGRTEIFLVRGRKSGGQRGQHNNCLPDRPHDGRKIRHAKAHFV
jgi:hypothetical protein